MLRREFVLGAMFGDGVRVDGSVLVHEHVLVDFAGVNSKAVYDRAEVARVARPYLEELKARGCVRMLECTPNGLGRDARLLRMLEDATGLELWTNTGIYGAAKRAGVPEYAMRETAAELARRWVEEARRGVDGVKPRFIKTAVNGFPLDELDRKLVEAAALASRETGLAIASHTNGGGRAMEAQLAILERVKCPLTRFVWVHAQAEREMSFHEQAARAGAWVEFDGVSAKSAVWHKDCVMNLAGKGLAGRVLVSQDAGWYHVGEAGGGGYRGYTDIYTAFLPLIDGRLWRPLLVENPRAAFGG